MKYKRIVAQLHVTFSMKFSRGLKEKNTCEFSLRVLVNGYRSTFEMQLKLNENLMHEEHTFI